MNRFLAGVLSILIPTAIVFAGDNKKSDPSEIGNRKVAGGPNLYSIEKELAVDIRPISRVKYPIRDYCCTGLCRPTG